ncbi:L,D-transpeptidase [Paracoccus sp. MBLB3053]|uniref:L,D-transpeptidase n=1 Tax=Paracoccus aurantius TaxID=3073814 RepID=A0ABU2HY82_9RHOB|nr:L,D-transpeptidase [Paracoccus sp. MBLB3053]MDS9469986.1 L,D-transpeptidase [Paracoccus sp. MBLB3053]
MERISINRRKMLAGMATGLGAGLGIVAGAAVGQVVIDADNLKPGEFTWHPENAPQGGVAVIVSLPEQRVHVYRNGIRIGVSTCSTGKKGHETPTGVFTILQKDRDHRSSTYNDAPMPNMNRLTWDGIALHAGNLPGYPASHGCVRLPMAFSKKLYGVTHVGTPVIIAGSHSDSWHLTHPGRLLSDGSESMLEKVISGLTGKQRPSDWREAEAHPVATVLASTADRRVRLFRNGRETASSDFSLVGEGPLGEHVLMLETTGNGVGWVGVTHHPDPTRPAAPEVSVLERLRIPDAFRAQLHSSLHPGLTLVLSDLPNRPAPDSGGDFVILTS